MPKVNRKTVVIEPEKVTPAVTKDKIVIELDPEEAAALLLVCGSIGGDNSSRDVFSNRSESLITLLSDALGVNSYVPGYQRVLSGSLRFEQAISLSDFRKKDA